MRTDKQNIRNSKAEYTPARPFHVRPKFRFLVLCVVKNVVWIFLNRFARVFSHAAANIVQKEAVLT